MPSHSEPWLSKDTEGEGLPLQRSAELDSCVTFLGIGDDKFMIVRRL